MYAEWIYTNNHWEKFGVASIDLNAYYTKTETDDLLDEKADVSDLDNYYTEEETDVLLGTKENAILKSVSGDIVSFDDAVEAPVQNLTVDIEPVQDLHGYDSPWPAGGGINKFPPIAISRTSENPTVSTTDDVYTINGTPTGYGQTIASDSFTLPAGSYYFKVFINYEYK